MTRDYWQEAIYVALGIPEAVTDRAGIAAELLDRGFLSPLAPQDVARQTRRVEARVAILAELATRLADGELDRLLVNLEDIERVAGRLAGSIGRGRQPEDVRERKAILDRLLPRLLATASFRAPKPPITLPFALSRPPL